MTIMKKLAEARTRIGVKKTGTNAFAKYSYYQIDEIYSEAKGIFNEIGIATVERSDIFAVGEKIFQKFYLDVINVDNLEDMVTFEVITEPNSMKGAQPAQEAGSTITYATKYLYGLALMIDDGKSDPDANNTHDKSEPVAKKSLTRTEMIDKVSSLDAEKLKRYTAEYSEREGKTTAVSPKFWKSDFLSEVCKSEGWIS